MRPARVVALLAAAASVLALGLQTGTTAAAQPLDPSPPATSVKLIFIHHSSGENWLADDNGGLGIALRDNNYFVSDTNYGWQGGGTDIGNRTDIGNWWEWFAGPNRDGITADLYAESEQHSGYSRRAIDPGGGNEIVMFKSCFPNSNLEGNPNDPPTTGDNPLRGSSGLLTVANAKGIYNDILPYFASRQDKLFVVITAPPVQDATWAANARAFNIWLATQWLASYPHSNVAVFDFYNVLTSNGGSWSVNDLGAVSGNHHRYRGGAIEYITNRGGNTAAYPEGGSDDHPSAAGNRKATGEFLPLLNIFYHRWKASAPQPTPSPPPSPAPRPIRRRLAAATPTPATSGCGAPQSSFVTTLDVRQTPQLPEPAPRVPFVDAVFGSCVVRVTDREHDLAAGDSSGGLKNEYSRVQSLNADETRILVRSTNASWYLYDAATLRPIGQVPLSGTDPRWDAIDPDLLYYSAETRLESVNVRTQATTVVHDFATDFPGQSLAAVWTRYEGSPSRDGRYWGMMAQDQSWEAVALLVYDRQANRVIASRDLRGVPNPTPDSVTISPSGTYLVGQFEYCEHGVLGTTERPCGLMVYDRALTQGRGLVRIIGHSDFAFDAQGHEVMIFQDNDTDNISLVDLASGAVTALWPIDFSHTPLGFHFSGQAFNRPGWALVSTSSGGHPTAFTWMDDQLFAVELKPNGHVVRFAHTHSIVAGGEEQDYWAEPQASVNRDFTRLLLTSNWGRSGTDEVEMLMVSLPADWTSRLP